MQSFPELAAAALQALPEAIVIADADDTVQFINPAACHLLDVSSDDVLGSQVSSLPGCNGFQNRQALAKYYEQVNVEWADKDIFLEPPLHAREWSTSVGDRSLSFRPVSLQQNGTDQGTLLRIRNDTLEMTAQDLLGVFFHEMRTPITSIHGYVELLIRLPPLSLDEQREWLEIIRAKAKQIIDGHEWAIEQLRAVSAKHERPWS